MYAIFRRFNSVMSRFVHIRYPVYREINGPPILPCPIDRDGKFCDWTDAEWELYLEAYREYNKKNKETEDEKGGCK